MTMLAAKKKKEETHWRISSEQQEMCSIPQSPNSLVRAWQTEGTNTNQKEHADLC